jgi:hypothetical protein
MISEHAPTAQNIDRMDWFHYSVGVMLTCFRLFVAIQRIISDENCNPVSTWGIFVADDFWFPLMMIGIISRSEGNPSSAIVESRHSKR